MAQAQPLNFTTASAADADVTPANQEKSARKIPETVEHISSPHELTAFVENVLNSLEEKFDEMSRQVLEKMTQMSTRVDALEASIEDLINNGESTMPQSPQAPR